MKKTSSLYVLIITFLIFSLVFPSGAVFAKEMEGKLTIHKFELEPDVEPVEAGDGSAEQEVPEDAKKLPGVTFEVTQTHRFHPESNTWTEVENGGTVEQITNEDGQVVFNNLPLGRYTVQETDGPPHVNLNENIYAVDIPMTSQDGSSLNYDVHIYPKNETIRGAVELTKKDGDSNHTLAGVQFELYHADGTKVKDQTFATDAEGKITVDNLAYGDYYFKEVATLDEYVLGSQRVEFSIEESNTVKEVDVKNYKSPDIEKEVDESAVNRGEIVTYTITNTLPGDIHEYNSYVISDTLDERLLYEDGSWTVEGVDASAFTFSQNGQQLTWSITDFAAFADVNEIRISFQAKIAEDAPANEIIENKAIIDFENKHEQGGEKETDPTPVTPTAGTLKLIKQDRATEDRLAGAVFELRDAEGELVETGTTDRNGELQFATELDYGDYQVIETKAPNGYRKLTDPIDVTIDANNHSATITVDNSQTGWELPQTGGIGTITFTLAGLILMGSSLILYLRKRRKENVS